MHNSHLSHSKDPSKILPPSISHHKRGPSENIGPPLLNCFPHPNPKTLSYFALAPPSLLFPKIYPHNFISKRPFPVEKHQLHLDKSALLRQPKSITLSPPPCLSKQSVAHLTKCGFFSKEQPQEVPLNLVKSQSHRTWHLD